MLGKTVNNNSISNILQTDRSSLDKKESKVCFVSFFLIIIGYWRAKCYKNKFTRIIKKVKFSCWIFLTLAGSCALTLTWAFWVSKILGQGVDSTTIENYWKRSHINMKFGTQVVLIGTIEKCFDILKDKWGILNINSGFFVDYENLTQNGSPKMTKLFFCFIKNVVFFCKGFWLLTLIPLHTLIKS